jgi:hypothetical protein
MFPAGDVKTSWKITSAVASSGVKPATTTARKTTPPWLRMSVSFTF